VSRTHNRHNEPGIKAYTVAVNLDSQLSSSRPSFLGFLATGSVTNTFLTESETGKFF
jgi:hypothetical protein